MRNLELLIVSQIWFDTSKSFTINEPPKNIYSNHKSKNFIEIQLEGYKPVLAHPERYLFYHQNTREYHKLKQQGCLFQLNLLSVVGYYGAHVTQAAETILQKGMYDFVGTDVHHQNHLKGLSQRIKTKGLENLKEAMLNNQLFRTK